MLVGALHVLMGLLIYAGYYYVSMHPPLVHMEIFLFDQVYVFEAASSYMLLSGLVLAIYLLVRVILLGMTFFKKAEHYKARYHEVIADKLVRNSIEAWILGKNDQAIKKFSKFIDIRGHELIYDLFFALFLSSAGQMQLSDAKILDLLNRRLIGHEVAAGIRARLYWHQRQAVMAVSILRQQLKSQTSAALLLLLCQILNEAEKELAVQYIDIVEQALNDWRLIKGDAQFCKVLYRAIELSIERRDNRFYTLWPYGKSVLSKDQIIFLDYKQQFSQDPKKAVDYLLENLQTTCHVHLYGELGLLAYRVDEQIQLANRWLSWVEEIVGVKVMGRLYFMSGDHHQGMEMAKGLLAVK